MGGFSKAYAMTGWRVGYLAAPAAILEGIVKVHQYGIMSAPTTAQDAALEAILGGEADVERMLAEYDRRRRLVVDGLNAAGSADVRAARRVLRVPEDHARPACRSETFAERLLSEEHVAVVPGAPSGRRARATSGCATRPRTRSSRRRSAGSAGSSSATRGRSRSMTTSTAAAPAALEKYEAVIGIEVHCQLQTASKMFCGCSTDYDGASPNTPRLPGLPRPAGRAADDQPASGRARPRDGARDRRDDAGGDALGPQELLLSGPAEGLPDQPVRPAARVGGPADVRDVGRARSRSAITRAHLEEDTAKLTHTTSTPTAGRSASSTSTDPGRR